jgi:hypothetical protein
MTINMLAVDLPGFWDGSEAQQLFKKDVKRGPTPDTNRKCFVSSRPSIKSLSLIHFENTYTKRPEQTKRCGIGFIRRLRRRGRGGRPCACPLTTKTSRNITIMSFVCR